MVEGKRLSKLKRMKVVVLLLLPLQKERKDFLQDLSRTAK